VWLAGRRIKTNRKDTMQTTTMTASPTEAEWQAACEQARAVKNMRNDAVQGHVTSNVFPATRFVVIPEGVRYVRFYWDNNV
jgi:hypothetical protein